MSIFTNLFKNDKKNDIFSDNQQLKRKRKTYKVIFILCLILMP